MRKAKQVLDLVKSYSDETGARYKDRFIEVDAIHQENLASMIMRINDILKRDTLVGIRESKTKSVPFVGMSIPLETFEFEDED